MSIAPKRVAVVTLNHIPQCNLTFKYERLGAMALENQRQYCARHGYAFLHEHEVTLERPAAWAKIPAILKALEDHDWVLWCDSDVLICDVTKRIENLCDDRFDLITQSLDKYFEYLNVSSAEGRKIMPLNSGVMLVRSSAWTKEFLWQAYQQEDLISVAEIWNGVADQEAMTAVLRERPSDLSRIKYVDRLQCHPKFYCPGFFSVHFYGNHGRHRIPTAQCESVLRRWEKAVRSGLPLPSDRARFHWCCIQNKNRSVSVDRGNPHRFLYQLGEIFDD